LITPNDVPASKLIEKLAAYLKENVDQTAPPTWASMVKTGAQAQNPAQTPDWWYVRCASLLRKIYIHGPIGLEELRSQYGGRKRTGGRPGRAAKSGGSVIRKGLQGLEAAGLVENVKSRGRRVTREGRKLLQEIAESTHKDLMKEIPELEKYEKGE
jgi:small subunit ribosomal protein S19e